VAALGGNGIECLRPAIDNLLSMSKRLRPCEQIQLFGEKPEIRQSPESRAPLLLLHERGVVTEHAVWRCTGLRKGGKLPDIWTEHPEIVRDLLREAGFTCGVAPRVLPGRDPEWTCIIDGSNIAGDIYIHQLDTVPGHGTPAAWLLAVLGLLLVVVLCQAWAIIRLRRRTRGSGPKPGFQG
jgi:hypothetical protein